MESNTSVVLEEPASKRAKTTEESPEEPVVDPVAKKKAKKAKKANNKAFIESLPTFSFNGGELKARREPIGIEDLRQLVTSVMLNNQIPRWLVVKNPSSIKHFVVLNIVGITSEMLDVQVPSKNPPAFPLALAPTSPSLSALCKLFSHACPSKAPGEATKLHSALSTFLTAPIPADEKIRRVKGRAEMQNSISNKTNEVDAFLLTPFEMLSNNYVLPSYIEAALPPISDVPEDDGWTRVAIKRDESWLETPAPPTEGEPLKPKIWAMDCEMLETTAGRELGRVTIVDFDSALVVFDSLVKPSAPVTSYLTQFSGLSEELMSSAAFSLSEIQHKLLAPGMIDANTTLIGHSLENDLGALKLAHCKVVDTSVIYHHTRGPPAKPGLKWLAQKWLNKQIQTSDRGHDSMEDAVTCVELVKQKMKHGFNYGRFDHDQESIFTALQRSGKTSAFIGPGANVLGAKASTRIDCSKDEEVMDALISNVPSHDLVFARLQQLSYALEWCTPHRPKDSEIPPPSPPPLDESLETLDTQLRRLATSLPAYTAVCVFTGHSDTRRMMELGRRKALWDAMTRGPNAKKTDDIPREQWWSGQDGRELETETAQAKKGLIFLCITLPKVTSLKQ